MFIEALKKAKKSGRNVVIPDIKCRSPKEGDLTLGRDPVDFARQLASFGASALSVVTESNDFGGSEELLTQIYRATHLPILRKDFLNDAEDIVRTKEMGAAAVLLMYSVLAPEKLAFLYNKAREIGLDVLVETHTAAEMKEAEKLGARLVGINNRDISQLEIDDGDVSRTASIAGKKPPGVFLVSESSLASPADVRAAIGYGADAALIGTAIWKASDPKRFYRLLTEPVGVKLCGLMDAEGIEITANSGAEILGFVVDYPEMVPWNLSVKEAAALLKKVPSGICRAVVTGGSQAKIMAVAEALLPEIIQLHHWENLEQTLAITDKLKSRGIKVVRSVPAVAANRQKQFGMDDLTELAKIFAAGGVDALLLDAREPENAKTVRGLTAPLQEFMNLQAVGGRNIPTILAGGITARNVSRILSLTKAGYIDVMSGIETSPGKKSPKLTKELFQAIHQSFAGSGEF